MQSVITAEQARKITKGRTPLVPVEYETAVKSLEQCLTLDEGKYWSDKADALAAWAKIHGKDEVGRKARMLKLHAFRRMGQLAREITGGNPQAVRNGSRFNGRTPGIITALTGVGLGRGEAQAARYLAGTPQEKFERLIKRDAPPSPTMARLELSSSRSSAWRKLTSLGGGPMSARSFCRNNSAPELATALTADEKNRALAMIREVIDWYDEFERHLSKAVK